MGFRNFSQVYLQDYAMIDKKSWQTDEYRLSKLIDFFKDIELREITPSMIRKFRASILKDGIAESTTNREMALLKKMFSLAIDEGYLEHDPVKKIKMYSEHDSIRDRVLLREEEPSFYAE
jgi:site-specific recombinase XerD